MQKDRPAEAADSSREAFLSLGESQVGSSQYFFVGVPAIVTLEKIAGALEVPLYQLFYEPPKLPNLLKRQTSNDSVWGSSGKQAAYFCELVECLARSTDSDRKLVLSLTQKLATGRNRRTPKTA